MRSESRAQTSPPHSFRKVASISRCCHVVLVLAKDECDVSIPDPITNSIVPVDIEAKSGQVAFDPAPTLEVRANIAGEPVADPASMEISPGTNTTRVRLKQGAISGEDTVQFEVIDTDTRETISKQTLKLDLLFGDDDMGFDV